MNPIPHETGQGYDSLGVSRGHNIHDKAFYKTLWKIDKWDFAPEVREQAEADMRSGMSFAALIDKYGAKSYVGKEVVEGNLLLNEGINSIWTLVAGGSETAFNNANARLGVGDSTTAEAASQTDLQASTNKLYKAMDASYPTYGTSQKITFRSTFGSSEANYAWQEFSVDNGSTPLKNLNRKVSAQGTKTSGQTWQLTLDITLS